MSTTSRAPSRTLSVIANAHIDPVWLWNRSSGRCSWNATIKNTVRMMAAFPELTFTCSYIINGHDGIYPMAELRWIVFIHQLGAEKQQLLVLHAIVFFCGDDMSDDFC